VLCRALLLLALAREEVAHVHGCVGGNGRVGVLGCERERATKQEYDAWSVAQQQQRQVFIYSRWQQQQGAPARR
jgi:hypothetical protein